MGVPKFFRYISERYPCLSDFVKEYQIPVFDNLYLDMNGIIHTCSHPDDNNPHFRITEEKLFSDIFHYIEVLFRMIKPQKVFFMAIDGVAPRAKMNQQRGRRFRSAKDAEKMENDAKNKGEELPNTVRFDSNCITPGTEFMAKLHEQLKYFVVKKISTDTNWRKCKIILSGHETPGEGEHKIMDYIRYMRSKPGYDPNTRHCLYGLDADLIILGLCTHDPHFSLLREEVKFGRKNNKRQNSPEEIRFFVLHLSLMREYLELEFEPVKEKLKTSGKFEFDIEKIIDDWVLMDFLVGNDFIPHLPNMHIANGALPLLYKAYMDVLPKLDGYINESGTLNLSRFEIFLKELSTMDVEHFEETRDDLMYMEAKTGRKQVAHLPVNSKGLCSEGEKYMDPALAALIQETDDLALESSEDEGLTTEEEDELAFKKFKDEYYRNKLEYRNVTEEVMRSQAEGYVRAIQWNLNYYYNGVCSWSWFYPHHYAPYISDIRDFTDLKIDFDLGQPFKPYEQLLAVLPAASKDLLPECYHHLMTDEDSPIKMYYPEDFQTDLNGKRQEWEAVVLVPFIDEKVLLDAMRPCNEQLTAEEFQRNTHGPMLFYEYTTEILDSYEAPNYFQAIVDNHAKCLPVYREELMVDKDKLIKGAYPGARFDVFYPGFPTLKHLKYTRDILKVKVRVFEQPSRNESLVLNILADGEIDNIHLMYCNNDRIVFIGWPNLVEAKVVGISTESVEHTYKKVAGASTVGPQPSVHGFFKSKVDAIALDYMTRFGINVGETRVLVHVQPMIGRKYVITGNGRITLDKLYSEGIAYYPLQMLVQNIKAHDDFQTVFREVSEIFPEGTTCFKVTNPHYGALATVLDSSEITDKTKLRVKVDVVDEPDFVFLMDKQKKIRSVYMSSRDAAGKLAISTYIFSRLTGSIFISTPNGEGGLKSVNIGLNLKFNKRNQETPGYTKRVGGNTWLYSIQAVELVRDYNDKFPEIFQYLSRTKGDDDLNYFNVFGGDSARVKDLQTWLKSLPIANIERRVCDSSVLEPELIEIVEKILDQFVTADESAKSITMEVHPKHLFKPESVMGNLSPDPNVQTQVFDRIVNVRDHYSVPLGLKGVVIAIHQAPSMICGDEMYDIVFDTPFEGGMALNCSEKRGYRLPKTSFINITYGQRCMGIQGQLRAKARENQQNNYKVHNNFDHTRKQQNSAFAPVNNKGKKSGNNNAQNPQQQTQHKNQRKPIDFMPTYAVKTNKENVGNTQKSKFEPCPAPVQILKPGKSKKEIDTESLKSLLKIGDQIDDKASKPSPKPLAEPQAGPSQSLSVLSERSHLIPNGPSATAKLLSFYQKNNLGCPRYTYFETIKNLFAAQVALPNHLSITGKGAFCTREEASENVANEILQMILNGDNIFGRDPPAEFPVPPVDWVLPPQKLNKNNHNNQQSAQPHHHRSKQHNNQSQITTPGLPQDFHRKDVNSGGKSSRITSANSFVPLQAMMKHGNKKKNGNNILKKQPATEEEKVQEVEISVSNKANQNTPQTEAKQAPKSRRHKRPKVAANFSMNKP